MPVFSYRIPGNSARGLRHSLWSGVCEWNAIGRMFSVSKACVHTSGVRSHRKIDIPGVLAMSRIQALQTGTFLEYVNEPHYIYKILDVGKRSFALKPISKMYPAMVFPNFRTNRVGMYRVFYAQKNDKKET